MSMSFAQAVAQLVTVSESEMNYFGVIASHTCPNCDGEITVSEHEHFGICSACQFPLIETKGVNHGNTIVRH